MKEKAILIRIIIKLGENGSVYLDLAFQAKEMKSLIVGSTI